MLPDVPVFSLFFRERQPDTDEREYAGLSYIYVFVHHSVT